MNDQELDCLKQPFAERTLKLEQIAKYAKLAHTEGEFRRGEVVVLTSDPVPLAIGYDWFIHTRPTSGRLILTNLLKGRRLDTQRVFDEHYACSTGRSLYNTCFDFNPVRLEPGPVSKFGKRVRNLPNIPVKETQVVNSNKFTKKKKARK